MSRQSRHPLIVKNAAFRNLLTVFMAIGCCASLAAQYRHLEPIGQGNPDLRNIKLGYVIANLDDDGAKPSWSSSYLPAEGKAPPKPDYEKYNNALDADNDSVFVDELSKIDAYNKWKTMYSAGQAQDGDPGTCWAVSGIGKGEVLIVRVDTTKPVFISSGYQKSSDLFKKNSRPRAVRVWVLEATSAEPNQFSVVYSQVKTIAFQEDELIDSFGQQLLPLPLHTLSTIASVSDDSASEVSHSESFVAIQILTVYPGTKYLDTCISEVSN